MLLEGVGWTKLSSDDYFILNFYCATHKYQLIIGSTKLIVST